MKAIKLIDLTDVQFQEYMQLLRSIKNKYEENSFVLDYDWNEYRDYYFRDHSDWEKFKKERLEILKAGKKFTLNEFIIFDSEKPVAWIAYKRLGEKRHEFIYDSEFDEVPEQVLEKLLEVINNFFNETGNNFISYYANDIHKKETFKKLGVEIVEENVNSKLLKKDIDFEKLRNIVDQNDPCEEL